HPAFLREVQQRGLLTGGAALQPTATATTVRIRGGKPLITDGPFAETKEQLAGFYILNCKDLDEAIEIAGKVPDSASGSIEIRPVIEF
ncbi:MAG TPA: YciI family protein, partial [Chthonomonadales bacterium]|nr:YciI family protein [Chthonomonadales bacterium]